MKTMKMEPSNKMNIPTGKEVFLLAQLRKISAVWLKSRELRRTKRMMKMLMLNQVKTCTKALINPTRKSKNRAIFKTSSNVHTSTNKSFS